MREIKFRGYSYAKQSWLYGNLIEKEDPTKAEPTPWVRLIHDRALSAELVAFDSVGQFTGLRDKNDKEIYEGDVVKIGTDHMVIGWSERFASFVIERKGWAFQHWFGEAMDSTDCEVIGNMYDK